MPNAYVEILTPAMYDRIPKNVFAAIAVSPFMNNADFGNQKLQTQERVARGLISEWFMLAQSGIIETQPTKAMLASVGLTAKGYDPGLDDVCPVCGDLLTVDGECLDCNPDWRAS